MGPLIIKCLLCRYWMHCSFCIIVELSISTSSLTMSSWTVADDLMSNSLTLDRHTQLHLRTDKKSKELDLLNLWVSSWILFIHTKLNLPCISKEVVLKKIFLVEWLPCFWAKKLWLFFGEYLLWSRRCMCVLELILHYIKYNKSIKMKFQFNTRSETRTKLMAYTLE